MLILSVWRVVFLTTYACHSLVSAICVDMKGNFIETGTNYNLFNHMIDSLDFVDQLSLETFLH